MGKVIFVPAWSKAGKHTSLEIGSDRAFGVYRAVRAFDRKEGARLWNTLIKLPSEQQESLWGLVVWVFLCEERHGFFKEVLLANSEIADQIEQVLVLPNCFSREYISNMSRRCSECMIMHPEYRTQFVALRHALDAYFFAGENAQNEAEHFVKVSVDLLEPKVRGPLVTEMVSLMVSR